MSLKNLSLILLFPLLTSCATAFNINQTVNGDSWYPVNLRPSQITLDGSKIYSNQLSENEFIEVYYDDLLAVDGAYYYNQLYASSGWIRVSGEEFIASQYATAPSRSTLYISIKRGVAIYLYPDDGFSVFMIRQVKSLH